MTRPSDRKPKFGERLRNTAAGEGNPHRDAYFIREVTRGGRLNPGTHYEMTDGHGETWLQNPRHLVYLDAAAPEGAQKPAAKVTVHPNGTDCSLWIDRDVVEKLPAGQEVSLYRGPPSQDAEDAARMAQIGELIRTQDNRITDSPIFIVQQKVSHAAAEGYNHDRIDWVREDGDHVAADADESADLEAEYRASYTERPGWRRVAMRDDWQFVTACFTEQGCKDYLARNGHNLREPRIYAEGSYRNEEWRFVRKHLIDAARAAEGDGNG